MPNLKFSNPSKRKSDAHIKTAEGGFRSNSFRTDESMKDPFSS